MAAPTYFTFRSVQYREKIGGSPNYSYDNAGNLRCTQMFWVPGETVLESIQDISGSTTIATDPGTGQKYLNRNVPMDHFRSNKTLYCSRISNVGTSVADGVVPSGVVDGLPSNDGGGFPRGDATYDECLLTVDFDAPPFEVLTDAEMIGNGYTLNGQPDESSLARYCSFNKQTVARFQTLPQTNALKWRQDMTPMLNSAVTLLMEADITIKWHQIPIAAIPYTAIKDCVGKCNYGTPNNVFGVSDAAKKFLGNFTITENPSPGNPTLLCQHPTITYYRQAIGDFVADIAYRFRYYPNGTNWFYRWNINPPQVTQQGFKEAWFSEYNYLFEATDFRSLFKPEP